jgi:hypothetical protein
MVATVMRLQVDANADTERELAGEDQARALRHHAKRRARRQDRHIDQKGALAADPVRGHAADRRPEHGAEHQRRADEPEHRRRDRKVALEQRQRDAQRHDGKSVEQSAAARQQPIEVVGGRHRRIVEGAEDVGL